MTLSLTFLSPTLAKTAIDGRLPRGFGAKRLMDLPMAWSDQWSAREEAESPAKWLPQTGLGRANADFTRRETAPARGDLIRTRDTVFRTA